MLYIYTVYIVKKSFAMLHANAKHIVYFTCEHSGKTKLYITWMQPLRAHRSPVWLWRKWKDVFLETKKMCAHVCVCVCACVCARVYGTFCMQHPNCMMRAVQRVVWKSVADCVCCVKKVEKNLMRRIKTNRKINYIDLAVILGRTLWEMPPYA